MKDGSDYEPPSQNGENPDSSKIKIILDAPDYASMVKIPDTAKSKEYRTKVSSGLKSLTFAAIRMDDFPDAAAFLHYGPDFATAAGHLADANESAAKAIDMLMSPESPYLNFFFIGLPMFAQLLRNHEAQIREIPARRKLWKQKKKQVPETTPIATLSVPFTKLKFKVRVGSPRKKLIAAISGFMKQTRDPGDLAVSVFSDEKLQAALRKQGIKVTVGGNE